MLVFGINIDWLIQVVGHKMPVNEYWMISAYESRVSPSLLTQSNLIRLSWTETMAGRGRSDFKTCHSMVLSSTMSTTGETILISMLYGRSTCGFTLLRPAVCSALSAAEQISEYWGRGDLFPVPRGSAKWLANAYRCWA